MSSSASSPPSPRPAHDPGNPRRAAHATGASASWLTGPTCARWLSWACRGTLAAVFLFAGVPKLLDPAAFATSIDNYHMMPASWVGPLALFLPVLEIIAAICLLTGLWWRGATFLLVAMLAAFILGIAQAMVRGIEIDCGCFGAAAESELGAWSIARNLALIACGCLAVCFDRRYRRLHEQRHLRAQQPPNGPCQPGNSEGHG